MTFDSRVSNSFSLWDYVISRLGILFEEQKDYSFYRFFFLKLLLNSLAIPMRTIDKSLVSFFALSLFQCVFGYELFLLIIEIA